MTFRTRGLFLLVPVLLALSACASAGAGANDKTSSTTQGAIEFAVSETCAEGSDAECVSVNGESITLPSIFERAGVEAAAVAQGEGQNAIDVTFTDDGAAVLHTLSEQAAGGTARLVMQISDEIVAAVMVPEALEGKQLQIALSPEESAQEIVDLIERS